MRRASSASSTGSLSTPVAASTWGSQRAARPQQRIYAQAVAVLDRLSQIDGMEPFLAIAKRPKEDLPPLFQPTLDVVPEGEIDPVSLLLRLFRLGGPLTLVYNLLHPNQPLSMISPEDALDIREVKRSIYHFISASAHELEVKMTGDHFMVTQVFGNSATDVLRPLQIVEMMLSRLDPVPASPAVSRNPSFGQSSLSGPPLGATTSAHVGSEGSDVVAQSSPQDKRSKVVDELLQTERKYVQDMAVLLQFHDEMINIGIPRETAAVIAPALSKLVDFSRRLLIGIEYQVRKPAEQQNLGWLFVHLLSGFEIYKTYTIGQKDAVATAIAESSALAPLQHILEPLYELPSTLLKPVQRILRYPMLLKEILKRTPPEWPHYNELQAALDAMQELTLDINETQRRAENTSVSHELQERVRDWKNIDISSLGELLLSGIFPVANQNEVEQEYHVYAFERCVLFFRDRMALKKTPLSKMRSNSNVRNSHVKSMALELRGRVYLRYLTQLSVTRTQTGYVLRISWGHVNDASEHGFLEMRMQNEELAQQWEQALFKQRAKLQDESNDPPFDWEPRSRSASVTSNTRSSRTSLQRWPEPDRRSIGAKRSSSGSSQTLNGFRRNSSFSNSGTSNSSFGSNHGGQPYPILTTFAPGYANGMPSASSNARNSAHINDSSLPEDVMPVQFWGNDLGNSNPIEALRKLSVGSYNSQHSVSGSATSIPGTANGSRSSLPTRSNFSQSTSSLNLQGQRKVRVHMDGDTFLLLIPSDMPFDNLVSRVQRKLRLVGKLEKVDPAMGLRFQYVDEDEDLVGLESDDDMLMAFDSVPEQFELSIYVTF